MKLAPLIAAVLVLCLALPGATGAKGKKPKPVKLCVGKDKQKYEIGQGYLDTKTCFQFTCVKGKKGKKPKMKKKIIPKPCSGPPPTPSTPSIPQQPSTTPPPSSSELEAMKQDIQDLKDVITSMQSTSNKHEISIKDNMKGIATNENTAQHLGTCLSDVNSKDCPESVEGRMSMTEAIMENEEHGSSVEGLAEKAQKTSIVGYNKAKMTEDEKEKEKIRLEKVCKCKVEHLESVGAFILTYDNPSHASTGSLNLEPSKEIGMEDQIVTISNEVIPTDPEFDQQWALQDLSNNADINAAEGWKKYMLDSKGGDPNGPSVVVAVIDTGVDYNHEDLREVMWTNTGEIPGNGQDDDGNGYVDDVYGYDFHYDDADPIDIQSHGTHCAGIIAAKENNGKGIAGVASFAQGKVKIMAVKGLSDDRRPSGSVANLLKCLNYAIANGATISSNSWGGGKGLEQLWKTVLQNNPDHLFVAAAGNDNRLIDDEYRPLTCGIKEPNLLCVASSTKQDTMSSFSNYGKDYVHVFAPGSNIYSTLPGNRYGIMSGTSMACPHVSGLAALIRTMHPDMNAQQVRELIEANVQKKAQYENFVSYGGLIDMGKTLQGCCQALKISATGTSVDFLSGTWNYVNVYEGNPAYKLDQYYLFYYQNRWVVEPSLGYEEGSDHPFGYLRFEGSFRCPENVGPHWKHVYDQSKVEEKISVKCEETCLTSPGYPNDYPDNSNVEHALSVAAGQAIEITFHDFDVETETNCNYDSLMFLDGNSNTVGEKMCGNSLPPKMTISTSTATAVFKSDYALRKKGYKFCYTSTSTGYRVSGIPTRQVTATLGSTIWINRPQYTITNMPQQLIGSTLFQPASPYVDISTIEVFSPHDAIIYVAVYESRDGGLMEVLPVQGWTLRNGWFVEWNLGAGELLILSKSIDAGETISFTTSENRMTFALFISKG